MVFDRCLMPSSACADLLGGLRPAENADACAKGLTHVLDWKVVDVLDVATATVDTHIVSDVRNVYGLDGMEQGDLPRILKPWSLVLTEILPHLRKGPCNSSMLCFKLFITECTTSSRGQAAAVVADEWQVHKLVLLVTRARASWSPVLLLTGNLLFCCKSCAAAIYD